MEEEEGEKEEGAYGAERAAIHDVGISLGFVDKGGN